MTVIGINLIIGNPILNGGGAAALAPFPAPAGMHWEFVTLNNAVVTKTGGPLIVLRSN
jgi:hypothetical protein